MKLEQLSDLKFIVEFDSEEEYQNFKLLKTVDTSMKAAEVMQLLNISRPTLCHYVKRGLVKIDSSYTGKQYRYDRDSVMKLLTK